MPTTRLIRQLVDDQHELSIVKGVLFGYSEHIAAHMAIVGGQGQSLGTSLARMPGHRLKVVRIKACFQKSSTRSRDLSRPSSLGETAASSGYFHIVGYAMRTNAVVQVCRVVVGRFLLTKFEVGLCEPGMSEEPD